jgi:cytochrome bd-type quinol oxidase subunit 2
MFTIDKFLLKQFQRITDWASNRFVFDNFQIAKYLQLSSFLLLLTACIVESWPNVSFHYLARKVIFAFIVAILFSHTLHKTAKFCYSKINEDFINPLKKGWFLSRSVTLAFSTLALISMIFPIHIPGFEDSVSQLQKLIDLFFTVALLLQLLVLYFGSCSPKYRE